MSSAPRPGGTANSGRAEDLTMYATSPNVPASNPYVMQYEMQNMYRESGTANVSLAFPQENERSGVYPSPGGTPQPFYYSPENSAQPGYSTQFGMESLAEPAPAFHSMSIVACEGKHQQEEKPRTPQR